MNNKKIVILLLAMLFLISCNQAGIQTEEALKATEMISVTNTPTSEPTPTIEITPSPTPVPTKPKYIFIVIGDGFGRGAMTLGEIYARLENEDMNKGAVWESFSYQSYVTAMGESASGGTAIASGVETDPWFIGKDVDGNALYTIMDRAKENGLATGVITNSNLVDATPATFLGHITNRYSFTGITKCFPQSNVDYMAGGGLSYILPESFANSFGKEDSLGYIPKLNGPEEVIPTLIEMGYETYFGMEGALEMQESVASNSFTPKKSIGIYTGGIMPYEQYKYKKTGSHLYDNVPSLIELTEAGIQSLSQNPDGFVMMIESALIDKTGHKSNQEMMTYEVSVLDDLLEHLMGFYNEHPEETLIILTADHETGNYTYDDVSLNEWKASANFTWTDDGKEMAKFIKDEWEVNSYSENLNTQISIANLNRWDTVEKNRMRLYSAVTLDICKKYGTRIRTGEHSGQPVPLYIIGKGSEEFEGSTHIKQIPITICEFMGWEALPEIIVPEE